MLGAPLQISILITCLSSTTLDGRGIRPSMQSKKRYGDNGPPSQRPLEGLMKVLGSPLTKIEKDTDLTHIIILFVQISTNPILCKIFSKKAHSTRSYVLLMSNLRDMKLVFPLRLFA